MGSAGPADGPGLAARGGPGGPPAPTLHLSLAALEAATGGPLHPLAAPHAIEARRVALGAATGLHVEVYDLPGYLVLSLESGRLDDLGFYALASAARLAPLLAEACDALVVDEAAETVRAPAGGAR